MGRGVALSSDPVDRAQNKRCGHFTSEIRSFSRGGVWGILMAQCSTTTNQSKLSSFSVIDNQILIIRILVVT